MSNTCRLTQRQSAFNFSFSFYNLALSLSFCFSLSLPQAFWRTIENNFFLPNFLSPHFGCFNGVFQALEQAISRPCYPLNTQQLVEEAGEQFKLIEDFVALCLNLFVILIQVPEFPLKYCGNCCSNFSPDYSNRALVCVPPPFSVPCSLRISEA